MTFFRKLVLLLSFVLLSGLPVWALAQPPAAPPLQQTAQQCSDCGIRACCDRGARRP